MPSLSALVAAADAQCLSGPSGSSPRARAGRRGHAVRATRQRIASHLLAVDACIQTGAPLLLEFFLVQLPNLLELGDLPVKARKRYLRAGGGCLSFLRNAT